MIVMSVIAQNTKLPIAEYLFFYLNDYTHLFMEAHVTLICQVKADNQSTNIPTQHKSIADLLTHATAILKVDWSWMTQCPV